MTDMYLAAIAVLAVALARPFMSWTFAAVGAHTCGGTEPRPNTGIPAVVATGTNAATGTKRLTPGVSRGLT